MNQFYNPIFLAKILKSYLFDINRLKRLNEESLKKFQDKSLKKIVNYAYSIPLYHDIYKKSGVHPKDINGIDDLKKLPFISKFDFKKYSLEGIKPPNISIDKLIKISTSGTTGKSLTLYADYYDVVFWLFWYIRVIRDYGINWRKNKMTIIGDFAPNTIASGFINRGLFSQLNKDSYFSNMQFLNTNDEPIKVIKEVNKFNPEFLGGYVGMLGHLALLKEKGYGNNINPRWIATIGSILTKPLRKLLEETFNAEVFEVYGATESGTIAFQCHKGCYHVISDLVYPEFFKNGKPVESKEPGKLVITKLYGRGTPIIRYDAVNDIVAPLYKKCTCGIPGVLLHKVYGRDDLCLFFSDGRVLLPSSIGEIHGRILYELKTNKIKHTRIIQNSLNDIEIKLMIDKNIKEKKPSVEEIFSVLMEGYKEKVGKDVNIEIKEVKKLSINGPRIVTKVDKSNFIVKKYI